MRGVLPIAGHPECYELPLAEELKLRKPERYVPPVRPFAMPCARARLTMYWLGSAVLEAVVESRRMLCRIILTVSTSSIPRIELQGAGRKPPTVQGIFNRVFEFVCQRFGAEIGKNEARDWWGSKHPANRSRK
jgi:hypothetical protein